MQVDIRIDRPAREGQVRQLLAYRVGELENWVAQLSIDIAGIVDARGSNGYDCRLIARLTDGATLDVYERQASLDLALVRALDRSVRTCRRLRRTRPAFAI